ncbi:hypothetical protein C8Q77DRAFT_1153040 [Trametes polyzona]|nr:hypothetical protein C8Q77DRAFT_1153040 [Trametes polyzona]
MLPLYSYDHGKNYVDLRPTLRSRCLSVAAILTLILCACAIWRVHVVFSSNAAVLPTPQIYHGPPLPNTPAYPPTYSEYHENELQLPQHHWDRLHTADDQKFFFVAGHTRGLGWGNALQEHLLNAYLAYMSGRTFVFANYTWSDNGPLFSVYNGKLIPSQIPYTALLRGPTVGDPVSPTHHRLSAVNKDYYQHICPHPTTLRRDRIHAQLIPGSALDIIDRWTSVMNNTEDPCIQSARDSGPIFTHEDVFGVRTSLLDLWSGFAASPIIKEFGWSRLVELAFDTNRGLFVPHASPSDPLLVSSTSTNNADRYTPIPGLMAIHVRRGDYAQHCTHLAERYEDFVSVNAFPGLGDPFTVPPRLEKGRGKGKITATTAELYRRRCFPSVDEIAAKVAQVRATPEGGHIRKLYIMTNGDQAFIDELKTALWALGEWDAVSSSRDMVLNWEQKYVAQAVDMLVAQRAQVFIGNGFSTLTSGAVMMRIANGFPSRSTRFW